MSEYWYDIKSDDADFDDEPVYANSEEVRQSIVEQQKYWLSLKFFIMKNQSEQSKFFFRVQAILDSVVSLLKYLPKIMHNISLLNKFLISCW